MSFEDPNKPRRNIPDSKRTGFTFRGQSIVLAGQTGAPKKGLVAKGIKKGMFPDEKKIEAAAIYATTGNIKTTSELTKVPESQVRAWRKQDDFQALLREVWQENNEKIDARFTAIIEKSLEQIVDRLDHGDFRLTRDGDLKRVPISAKELSLVQAINVDKRQLLRGLPTSRSETGAQLTEKTVDRLEQLAATFENLSKLGRKPKVIDIETVEVKNEQKLVGNGAGTDAATPQGHPENEVQTREV